MRKITNWGQDLHSRSCGLEILPNGTSSRRAQEHSTTATPHFKIISRSEGEITRVPCGLTGCQKSESEGRGAMRYMWKEREQKRNAYETTMPRNRDPTLSSLMRPRRASFLPEQRRGSQWLKSWSEVVPWTSVRVVCTYPHRHGNLYPNLWNPVYQSVSDKPKWAKARGVPESDDDISISSLDSSVTPSTSSTALSGRSSNDGDEMVVDKSLKRPLLDVPRPLPRPRLWEDPPRPEEFFLPMGWSESCYWISPGGHRTGAPGKHVIGGKAKYRLVDEKVRVFVAPPLSEILSTPASAFVDEDSNNHGFGWLFSVETLRCTECPSH